MVFSEYLSGAYSVHNVPKISPRLFDFESVDLAWLESKVVDKAVPDLVVILPDDLERFLCLDCGEVVPVRVLNEGIELEGAQPGEKAIHIFFQRQDLLFL